MRVKIISDSTCDLSPELLERYDIAITPLCVIKDGEEFHDGVDITPADIFAHVDGGGSLCSTAAAAWPALRPCISCSAAKARAVCCAWAAPAC